jgi:polysaccharide export outer membrane protein
MCVRRFLTASILAIFLLPWATLAQTSTPPSGVQITGAVKAPGAYPYQDGLTALNAVILAGGFQEIAKPNMATIERAGTSGKLATIAVNIKNILRGTDDDVPLKPGDHLDVPQ